MDQPIFALSGLPEPLKPQFKPNALLVDLAAGKYDALFDKPPEQLSELFRQAQNPPEKPRAELLSSSPFRPTSDAPLNYPVLAKLTHISGQLTFTLTVTPDGGVSNVRFLSGHILLQKGFEAAVTTWRFPTEAVGQEIRATIEFKMNCPSPQGQPPTTNH